MRRPTALSLESFTLSQALARGLRASFDDAVSGPLPEHLAALLRRLNAGRDELPSEAPDHKASATGTSSIPDR
jgi:Anti-sigma factor NepR